MDFSTISSLPLWLLALLTILAAFVVQYVITSWLYLRKSLKNSAPFDGPSSHWLTGNVHQATFDDKGLEFHVECTKKFPKAYKLWFGPMRVAIYCVHPETVKAVATTASPKGMFIYRMLIPWLGWGLLISYGPKWQRMRRLLTPAFHFNILKPYVNVFDKSARQMLANWESVPDGHIELFHHVSLFTLDSMLKCALSYDSGCQNRAGKGIKEKDLYIDAVFGLTKLVVKRVLNPWFYSDAIYYFTSQRRQFLKLCDIAHKKAEEIIKARKIAIQNQDEADKLRKKKYLDFLDILLAARDTDGAGLSDEEIRAEVDTFLFEGHDTTACGIVWSLYCLAKYPEHQTRCRKEVQELFRNKITNDLDWDDLKSLDYLTLCIKESMRVLPPVPQFSRNLDKDIILDGKVAPKGSWALISIYALHHNPEVWENPEVFDPQRFTIENSKDRPPHAYLPFSSGPRNCIGQNFALAEIKTAVALALLRFDLTFDEKHKVELLPEAVLRSSNGVYIYVKPRKGYE